MVIGNAHQAFRPEPGAGLMRMSPL